MNEMRLWTGPVKGAALFFAAAFFCSQAVAQIEVKRSFPSEKRITAFDNTTFCTAFLSNGSLFTLRDIPVADLRDIDQIIFNPTGSSLALLRGKKEISIYSFRDRNKKMFELKEKRKGLKARKNLSFVLPGESGAELMKDASKGISFPLPCAMQPMHVILLRPILWEKSLFMIPRNICHKHIFKERLRLPSWL